MTFARCPASVNLVFWRDDAAQCDRLRWAVTPSQEVLLNNCNNI
ncbi:MAG: hypothetical protein V7L01_24810 [Nostoc sp.]